MELPMVQIPSPHYQITKKKKKKKVPGFHIHGFNGLGESLNEKLVFKGILDFN